MRMKQPKLLEQDYSPQGSIRQAVNNMPTIVEEGARVGAAMPVSAVLLRLAQDAGAAGWDDQDMSVIRKALAVA